MLTPMQAVHTRREPPRGLHGVPRLDESYIRDVMTNFAAADLEPD